MESLYARNTPEHDRRKRDQVMASRDVVQPRSKNEQQSPETFDCLMDTATESTGTLDNAGAILTLNSSTNSTDDDFGFNLASMPSGRSQHLLGLEWYTSQRTSQEIPRDTKKTEEGRLAELSKETISLETSLPALNSEKFEPRTAENPQQEMTSTAVSDTTLQSRRARVASVHCRLKPAIRINTGLDLMGVCAKRPFASTPASPSTFSWNDILRVQHLIERCLQQYLSKANALLGLCAGGRQRYLHFLVVLLQNDILILLNEQNNVDPAFANFVWQKLEEQNPKFFRAYSLQLQLKEQIIAFNYLVGQQTEMTANGRKCVLQNSNLDRQAASRASDQCMLVTALTSTAVPPINKDARTLLRTPFCSARQQHQHTNMCQLGCSSKGLSVASSGLTTLPSSSPLPLPSPIKTDLDTHAFFT